MLSKVLENFDWKAQSQRKLNSSSCLNDKSISNENLESFYISKWKEGVMYTHNKVWANCQVFDFEPNRLIIDLSQNPRENEPFFLLDLY